VDHRAARYRIRLARPEELPRLREIENRAGTRFSGLGLIKEAHDVCRESRLPLDQYGGPLLPALDDEWMDPL
jgi:hypothetical protein